MRGGEDARGTGLRRALAAGLLLTLTALAFASARDNGFVDWDDDVYVTANPLVTDASRGQARRILTTFVSGNYHPLTIGSHALEHRLFGSDPRPYHLVNLGLHLLNTVLVFGLLSALGTPAGGAFVGALLWALHPLRVEAVAWVSGRKDLLAALFSLLSLLWYLKAGQGRRRLRLALSCGAFLLALLAKGTAAALPAALFLIDGLRGRRPGAASLREKLPYLFLAAVFAVVAVAARSSYQGVLAEQAYGGWALLLLGTVRLALAFLLRSVVPVTDPTWLYPPLPPGSILGSPLLLLSLALLAGVAALVALSCRRTGTVAFGLSFFVVTILPALPVSVLGYSADRFTYLPSVGLAFVAGALAARCFSRARAGGAPAAAAALGLFGAGAAATLFGIAAARGTSVWRSSETLWTEAVYRYRAHGEHGANLARALAYRARALQAAGRAEEALRDNAAAVRADPGSAALRNELGISLGRAGRHSEALAEFTRAIELDPSDAVAWFNRGVEHLALGENSEAGSDFTRSLEADPGNAPSLLGRARALQRAGEDAEALRDVEDYLAVRPGDPEALRLREALRTPSGGIKPAPRAESPAGGTSARSPGP